MTTAGVNPTSYFSEPEKMLDPTLFQGRVLQSWVRTGIVALLNDFLGVHYRHPELWSRPWLAGSGVSYQWSANRQPADLDCLIGVDYLQFRKANPEFAGLSDTEISEQMNEEFREELQPKTANWNGYELTFYVNPGATDIRSIKPYAAYDLKYDEWTVHPDPNQKAPVQPAWDSVVASDAQLASQAHTRYTQALNDVQTSHNDALRRNAQNRLTIVGQQASALYDEIHSNRGLAFSSTGTGYADFHNYRWQAGKRLGTIGMLRSIRENLRQPSAAAELPDARTLIRRAATYRKQS